MSANFKKAPTVEVEGVAKKLLVEGESSVVLYEHTFRATTVNGEHFITTITDSSSSGIINRLSQWLQEAGFLRDKAHYLPATGLVSSVSPVVPAAIIQGLAVLSSGEIVALLASGGLATLGALSGVGYELIRMLK